MQAIAVIPNCPPPLSPTALLVLLLKATLSTPSHCYLLSPFFSRFSLHNSFFKSFYLRFTFRGFVPALFTRALLRAFHSFIFLLPLPLLLLSLSSAALSFVQMGRTANLVNHAHNPLPSQIVAPLSKSRSALCGSVQGSRPTFAPTAGSM